MLINFFKTYYKIFLYSFLFWLISLLIWDFINTRYQIEKLFLNQVSKDLIVTTILGLITTASTTIYNYLKNKSKQNLKEIQENRDIFEKSIRRLEDLIDQQTFELRRLDDFEGSLKDLEYQIRNIDSENRTSFRVFDLKIQELVLEQEKQKEQIIQGDRILMFSNILREDVKEREKLKLELQELIKQIEK